ncbi:hypothetical protein EDB80DRAFT_689812 [Ilyonectria destructans]|nr:hypothetical protein EDB80DRAFT_689812 [Ilyonectria destructans]
MPKTRQWTSDHPQPTESHDGKKGVDSCTSKRLRKSSPSQENSNASPPTSSAMESSSKMSEPHSDETLPPHSKKKKPGSTEQLLPTVEPFVDSPQLNLDMPSVDPEEKPTVDRISEHVRIEMVDNLRIHDGVYTGRDWCDVHGSIWDFAHRHFKDLRWDQLDECTKEKFTTWAPNARKVFEMTDGSTCFFTSWIWRILVNSVFNRKSNQIKWVSPYFKAQNDMLNHLQELKPDVASTFSFQWNRWRMETVRLFELASTKSVVTERTLYRIDQSCIRTIIADGLGSYFPREFEEFHLVSLGYAVVQMEMLFAKSLVDVQLIFYHPTLGEISEFAFQPEIDGWDGHAMTNVDYVSAREGTIEERARQLARQYKKGHPGRPVDFVVAPMMLGRHLRASYRDQFIREPMVVCVGWVADFDLGEEEKDDGKKKEEGKSEE